MSNDAQDEPGTGGRPGRGGWGRLAAVGGIVVALLVLVTLASTSGLGRLGELLPAEPRTPPPYTPPPPATMPTPIGTPSFPSNRSPMSAPTWVRDVVPFLIALVVLVVIGILVRLVTSRLRGTRLHKATAARSEVIIPPEPDEEEVLASFDDSLERLRLGGDVDHAILECWRRLEGIAEQAGLPRRPEQTATEFVVDLMASTAAPREALHELAGLYRAAMFSTHSRGEDERERAIACLERLRDALNAAPASSAPISE
ncbi:DUF4129 domain-containing protein [Aestuariimicrobium soli]|uniref:DUF4129 domain-containing protein n=1 Tax=Aestuariimicrobium soli TaxID=2035834 RepID=UPI003EB7EE81